MSGFDYVVLGSIVVSTGIGVWRGFVRETISLLVWIAAFWLAYLLTPLVEVYLAEMINDKALRLISTFVVLFISVHIVGFVLSRLGSKLVKKAGLKETDRIVGGVFGVVRGVVIIAVLVLLIDMTPFKEEPMWQESYLVSLFKDGLEWVNQRYPLDKMSGGFIAAI
jgi:membrane protein required for colicin V production